MRMPSRAARLAAVTVVCLVVLILSPMLVEPFGDNLLAVLSAAVLLLLVANTLRTEQQNRRIRSQLTSIESAVKTDLAALRQLRHDLRPNTMRRRLSEIHLSSYYSLARLRRLETSFTDSHKKGLLREVSKVSRRDFEQVQATINLFAMVEVKAAVPPMRLWAVSPDALTLLMQEMLVSRPALVVECGSGVSTLWMALAAKQHGIDLRIVALDHEAEYADKTNRMLEQHGVSDIASARLAPLVDVPDGEGGAQRWYDTAALHDLDGIGLLFVDGPPASTGPHARMPALSQLWDRLADRMSIVVDDMIREDEQEIVARWSEAHPELDVEHYDTEKGTEILRRA
ncbi:class I SAM-dependent methyltransferase [Aeromicrobium sp.]|uniref:class I SAM-dependent methyltransferase n=1 Tax=Aeromicrobium sp. TaxID=1871063 RepID=UPI0019B95915|nr:class I SAM-dependent methyltransferase [Aeromicrobium sp.]MBC7631144.1 class I SAM-dependent methyltransferase [Aeromicrobium sp.]